MKTVTAILEWFGYIPQHEPALHGHAWGPWLEIGDLCEMAAFSWGAELVSQDSEAFKKRGFLGYMQYRTCKDCGLTQQIPVCQPSKDFK